MDKKKTTPNMMQAMACAALMIGYGMTATAQEGKTNQAHVGIVYPLSTNGKTAPADTNNFSLHLIAGVSQQENVCLIAGISGVVKGNAYGTMISGISNHVGGNASGLLVAGMMNQVKGKTRGLQVAGLINKSDDAQTQVAGLINIAKRVEGVQVAGLINIAEQSDYPVG